MSVYLYKNLNFSKTKAAFMGPVYWPVLYTGYLLRRKQFLNRARKQKVGLFHWPAISTENLHADTTSSDKFLSRSLVLNLLRLFCFPADLPFTLCHEIDLTKEGEKLYCIFF